MMKEAVFKKNQPIGSKSDGNFHLPSCSANEAHPSSQGHHREVWCVAISPSGDHLVSASHDKSLRLWERTREPVILEEEREMVRRARPAAVGWRLPALTDPSSLPSGARGGV